MAGYGTVGEVEIYGRKAWIIVKDLSLDGILMKKIVLIGSGGHAKSIVDTIERLEDLQIEGFIDYKEDVLYRGYQIIGSDDDLSCVYQKGIRNAFICVGFLGQSNLRNSIYEKIKANYFELPSIIDPSCILAKDVCIGEGSFVGKHAIINSASSVGKMCIVNSNAVIEHDCTIDDFSHISVSATICGGVKIGYNTMIGANATVIQGVKIGNNAIVGAGTTVLKDIGDNEIYYGNKI